MIDILGTPEATPFVVALVVMILISLMEGISMFFGAAVSGLVDGVLPDLDLPDLDGPDLDADLDLDIDVDADVDLSVGSLESVGPFTYLMSWLSFGKAPALVLLIAFLTVFGLAGLTIQSSALSLTGVMLPSWLASIPAFMIAMPGTRYFGRAFGAVMPKDETDAVSTERFIGKIATIIRGTARRGLPAEAKLKDRHGLTHWILVEPDEEEETFAAGDEVIVVSQAGSLYRVIRNTHAVLSRP
jgi:hypothetical protein